jgi:hypothetical protein
MCPVPQEKAVKRSVSFAPSVLAAAQKAADARQGGNLSRYVNELLAAASRGQPVQGLPAATSPACLVDLCERFAPTYANEMRERVEGVDQPKALEYLLKQYAVGMLGLSDEFLRSSYPLSAAEPGGKYPGKKGKR